ncbi:MAG: universal stress protein [Chloroflexota bacterium]
MHDQWGVLQPDRTATAEEAGARDECRLLVALDGSAHAAAVLPDAVHLARCLGGSLLLVRAMSCGSTKSLVHGAREPLARLARAAQAQGVAASILLLEGEPAEQIVSYALGNAIAAIAVGSRVDWGNDGGLYGSVADAIIRQSPVPVLVRCSRAERTPAAPSRFQRVLVPLDGSRLAERAVPDALTLARASGGRVLLVQVIAERQPFIKGGSSELVARELQAAGEYLTAVRERHWHVGVPIEVTVRLGRPAEVIRWIIQETAADLVVMATHGRAGLHRERMGSVALDVLQAEAPLLLRPPGAVRHWDDRSPALRDVSADHQFAV